MTSHSYSALNSLSNMQSHMYWHISFLMYPHMAGHSMFQIEGLSTYIIYFSPLCILICWETCPFWVNVFPHTSHLYGFSPVCILIMIQMLMHWILVSFSRIYKITSKNKVLFHTIFSSIIQYMISMFEHTLKMITFCVYEHNINMVIIRLILM